MTNLTVTRKPQTAFLALKLTYSNVEFNKFLGEDPGPPPPHKGEGEGGERKV